MRVPQAGVWLDARGAQSTVHPERGIARYIAEHTRALVGAAPGAVGAVRLDAALPVPPSLETLTGSGVLDWHTARSPGAAGSPSIYHVMSPFQLAIGLDELWPDWVRRDGIRTVVTLYDLIPRIFRERYLDPDPFTAATYTARLGLIRAAHQVLTISKRTGEDAVELLGIPEGKVTVIDSGVSSGLASLVSSKAEADSVLRAARPTVRQGFLLYVGGDDPRKNLEGTISAYSLLPESLRAAHQLVIVCRLTSDRRRQLTAQARDLGIDPADLLLTGFVPERELAALYRSCALFVFPSLYEGAGLPILEAMSCGAPVVASRTSSIPEILGDLKATFDPADPGDIASCLRHVLETPGERELLRGRSRRRLELFTWEHVVQRTLEGYERALSAPVTSRRRRGRKRLAVVTPWPSQASGVATHSRRLVEGLAHHADVDVIVPAEEAADGFDRSLEPQVRLRTDADFDWFRELHPYDRCLCVLGGSRFHAHAFEALMRVPAVVLAHDVRLVGVYLDLSRRRYDSDPRWFEGKLAQMYGDRIPRRDLRLVQYEDLYAEYGIFMTDEVQAHAERILVHSAYQEDVLRLDSSGGAAPTEIVPHGIPPMPATTPFDVGGDGPLIVSYGVVSVRAKRLGLLLEGFARLASERPGARLLLIGEITEAGRRRVEQIAEGLGIGGRVEARGRVGEDEYWGILRSAQLAIQLRGRFNGGEASGAVADCIAAGIPTIVSEIGWFAELPPRVVLSVPSDCPPATLSERMASALDDADLRARVSAAQDEYAVQNSFARVAERYAELLAL